MTVSRSPVEGSWSPPHLVLRAGRSTGRPVIWVPGWPRTMTLTQHLDEVQGALPHAIYPLLRSGRTVIVCAPGSSFGTTTTYPATGGLGRGVINSAITLAGTLGCDTTTIDLVGVSHGGVVATNWAWRNEARLHRMWLWSPGWDLSFVYDQDATTQAWFGLSISPYMRGVYGAADKTAWTAASVGEDPHRNLTALDVIAARTAVVAAVDDEVLGYASLAADAAALGITLTPLSSGGHLFAELAPEWSDFAPLRWFS